VRVGIALFILVSSLTIAAERALLWRDPGAIDTMNMVAGPEGSGNAPVPPFRFVAEETRGVSPKLVVLDAGHVKWMVKFGEEAKAEIFASRISWAAGYPVRASYYVGKGRIEGISSLKKAARFVGPDGVFQQARFQMFDHEGFREISGGKLDLYERRANQRELNGLKLTLLLVANWDVKSANTGIFEINGQRYAAITDWGASMGDPAAIKSAERKWSCSAYSKRTKYLMDGVENGYVQFNYTHYAARHENALSYGIRIEHLRWFLSRMQRLTDTQVHAALLASGATAAEASCFTQAFRERLDAFAATAGEDSGIVKLSR
jgi:hypothetical protein